MALYACSRAEFCTFGMLLRSHGQLLIRRMVRSEECEARFGEVPSITVLLCFITRDYHCFITCGPLGENH